MDNKNSTSRLLTQWWDFRLKLFLEGILCGLFTGFLVVVFRLLIERAESLRSFVYGWLKGMGIGTAAAWFLILIFLGWLLGKIKEQEPMISGSGIPQVKGLLSGHLKMGWFKIVIGKFVGGILAIGGGLSLGREGPSIQIGSALAQGISRGLGRLKIEEKYLITSGASAGLAAAFNAPLAGVIFALEEMHKNFSAVVLTSAMAASLTADFVSQNVFGQKPIFNFHNLPVLPLKYYFLLILLGLILGAFGVVFNRSLIKTMDFYNRISWLPQNFHPAIPLIVSGFLGFLLPQALGGGHSLIEAIGAGTLGLKMLFVLLAIKFIFTLLSYGSGVPGGIFLPLLVIGALAGNIFGSLTVHLLNFDPHYVADFVVLAMAAYFTAIVKAPVTGSVLITEMTGSFNHLLPLMTVSMTAYLVCDILKSEPIYDVLLNRLLKNTKTGGFHDKGESKTIIEVPVCVGSLIAGKRVRDIIWPDDCLIVALKTAGGGEIIPKGNTRVFAGDYLVVLTSEKNTAPTGQALSDLAGDCSFN